MTLSDGSEGIPGELDLRATPPTVLHNLDTPTICALNGGAAGYGLDLALGCDMRILGHSSRLLPGFAKRGVVPESGGTWYLPRLLGWGKAAELIFMGKTVLADEALDVGAGADDRQRHGPFLAAFDCGHADLHGHHSPGGESRGRGDAERMMKIM